MMTHTGKRWPVRWLARLSLVGVLLAAARVPVHVTAAGGGGDTEAAVGACGVERWAVKTGTDPDARRVNQQAVVPTSIFRLRRLMPPAVLPARIRIRPVETTVWAVDAILLRYKEENDSDYHLVIADTGGRTMIAEIPAPQCVGSSSPFLPAIRVVRRLFTAQFHPTRSWQRVHVRVHIAGVGFFDFKHGQSGVAPNAIELHPVLRILWSGAPAPSTVTAPGTPTPQAAVQGGFIVRASVTPNPVAYGSEATLHARSVSGAVCTASVVYSTGRVPRSFDGSAQTVGSSGIVAWTWHMESHGTGGTATVTCVWHGQTRSGTADFSIA